MVYLGAANFQDDVPSESAYGWGLYVPAGAYRGPEDRQDSGFCATWAMMVGAI
jgi:hypothetical protein